MLGFPLSRLCFEGPEEELRTDGEHAAGDPDPFGRRLRDLEARFPERLEGAAIAAGHSLGEYSANVAAGSLVVRRRRLRLVRQRGRFMQEAVPEGVGAMAAILGLAARRGRGGVRRGRAGRDRVAGELQLSGADRDRRAHGGRRSRVRALHRARGQTRPAASRLGALSLRPDGSGPRADAPAARRRRISRREDSRRHERRRSRRPGGRAELRAALLHQIDSPVRWVDSVRRLARKGSTVRSRSDPERCWPGSSSGSIAVFPLRGYAGRAVIPRRALALLLLVSAAGSRRLSPRAAPRRGRRRAPRPGSTEAVDEASRRCRCRIGVSARHLESGRTYEKNADAEFEAASVVKIGVLTEAMARVTDRTRSISRSAGL